MIVSTVAAIAAFGGLMIGEAVIKPVAIATFDRIVLPGVANAFRTRINPQIGDWLATKNGEELSLAITEALADVIEGFDSKPAPVQKAAVERVIKMYDPRKTAEQLALSAAIQPQVD